MTQKPDADHASLPLDPPHAYLLEQVQKKFDEQFPRCVPTSAASERPAPAIRPTMTHAGAGPSIEESIADALAVNYPNRKRAESV